MQIYSAGGDSFDALAQEGGYFVGDCLEYLCEVFHAVGAVALVVYNHHFLAAANRPGIG